MNDQKHIDSERNAGVYEALNCNGQGHHTMAIDFERMKWAERVFDLDRLCGELKHFSSDKFQLLELSKLEFTIAVLAERRNRMFQQILCPTDLKKRTDIAVKKAVQIAHQFGSKITLLNIHEEFMDKDEREMLRVSVNKMKEKFRHIAFDSKEEMKAVIHRLHADDIEVEYLLHDGKPEKVIVEVAVQLGIDLIVMCTDGRDGLMDFVTGTITEHVINASPCPVLVIPNRG